MSDPNAAPPGQASYPYPAQPPQPYGYPQPGYYGYPVAPVQQTDNVSIAAMVTGIAGVTMVPLFASIAALILGVLGLNRTRENGTAGRGFAIAGIVLGIVGIMFAVLGVLLIIWLITSVDYRHALAL